MCYYTTNRRCCSKCLLLRDIKIKDDDINAYFDNLLEGSLQGGGTFGNTEIFYSPDLELSYGHHRGHIKIEAR